MVRRLEVLRIRDEAAVGPIRRRAARRREQGDERTLGIDRLVIGLELEVVDQAALQGDRTGERRRVDRHPRAEGERLGAGPGTRVGRRLELRRRRAIDGRRRGARRRRLGLGRRRRRHVVLMQLRRVKIVPADQNQHRKDDRQYEVAGILGIHDRLSLSLARGPDRGLSRRSCRKPRSISPTSASKSIVSAGKRAIST